MEANQNIEVKNKKGFNPIVMSLVPIIIFLIALFMPILGLIGTVIIGYVAIRNIGKHKIFSIITLILSVLVFLCSLILLTVPDDKKSNNEVTITKNNDVESNEKLTENEGSWPDTINTDKDSNAVKMTRKFLTIVYGENGLLDPSYIKNVKDYSQKGMEYIEIDLKDKTYFAVSRSNDNTGDLQCAVLYSELTNGKISTAFPAGENGNKLEKPSENVIHTTQKIVDSYKELLPNYDFKSLDKENFSLSEKMYGLQLNNYVVRPDGYSQIIVAEFDKNGNNAMTIYVIFDKEQVIGAGISPKYIIKQGM